MPTNPLAPPPLDRTYSLAAWTALTLLVTGTLGYHWLEQWPLFDAFYMTIITLSTVGYGELRQLSTGGRVLTVFLILGGVTTLGYALSTTAEFFAHGGLRAQRRRRKMEHALKTVENHTIVCGYGRLGRAIVDVLRSQNQQVVVVDRDLAALARRADDTQLLRMPGDALDDNVLLAAGIQRARALVAAIDNDASNVFLTLSARELNPRILLYAKADDPKTLQKLQRAGATEAFSPAHVAGHRIGWQIVQPDLTDLLDIETRRGEYELKIEEISARDALQPGGQTLAETRVWANSDKLVVAVKRADGSVVFPPKAETPLHPEDQIVVLCGKT